MQYQVRVDDGESSVVVESFSELGQAVDCYVLQILALTQADVDIQLFQLIGEDDECVPITSHTFVWTDPYRRSNNVWTTIIGPWLFETP